MILARFILLFSFLPFQTASAMEALTQEYPIKFVLLPLLANAKLELGKTFTLENIGSVLEEEAKSNILLPKHILAYEHQVFLSWDEGGLRKISVKKEDQRDIVHFIEAALWYDISQKKVPHSSLPLKDATAIAFCSEVYNFITLWLEKKQEIEKEYQLFLNSNHDDKKSFGVPEADCPNLHQLMTFMPRESDGDNLINHDDLTPINITGTLSASIKKNLNEKESWEQFLKSINSTIYMLSKQLYYSAFESYIKEIISRHNGQTLKVLPAQNLSKPKSGKCCIIF